jgi:hypothetical protein
MYSFLKNSYRPYICYFIEKIRKKNLVAAPSDQAAHG